MKRIGFITAFAVGIGIACFVLRSRSSNAVASPNVAPPPITVGRPERTDLPIWLTAVGTIQSLNTVNVKVRVDGQLQSVSFVEGGEVKKGDVLARIDPRPFAAALGSAEAVLSRDGAQLENAKINVTRFEKLAAINAAPTQTLDTYRTQVAELDAARQGDRAAIDAARLNLEFTTIRSPIDGRVGLRLVDPGSIVHPSDPGGLVTVTQMEPIAVIFPISQDWLSAVRDAGEAAPVTVASHDGTQDLGQGRLMAVDSQIDATTGQVRLKATLPNTQRTLWPGELVTAKMLLRTEKNVLVVPASTVLRGQKGTYVYVAKSDAKVEARPVEVGPTVAGRTLVRSGLSDGDTIVLSGQSRLSDGALATVTGGAQ